ncbi:hypothetical protein IJI94_02600 [Candidatus Saccharibacteria bacterium]|nr:hypothetical protein [Candidatus Saccharibacteria bacterium]
MKSPENFKPFTINTQPDASLEPTPKTTLNIPNINGSNNQTSKPVDIPNFTTPHPAKEAIDFSKAENPDDFTHKVREHQKHPSFASKIVKTEIQDLGERAREIRKRHKNIGAKTLATVLATTTIFTAAGAIKRDKKDVDAINITEKAPVEDSVDYKDIEDQIFSFDEDTNEVSIHQKDEKKTEDSKVTAKESTPKAEAAKENQEDSIEMDMDVELDLTDSMEKQLQEVKKIYDEHLETYKNIAERVERDIGLKIPPEMICAIHYRESSCDFTTYLHNGEKLGKPTTLVPAGINFNSFTAAAVDAIEREIKQFNYNTNRFHLKNDLTTLSSIAMFTETFNGTGARDYHDSYSSYVYTGTNKYRGGMYTADSKWSDSATDKRPGTIPIFLYLHQPAEE